MSKSAAPTTKRKSGRLQQSSEPTTTKSSADESSSSTTTPTAAPKQTIPQNSIVLEQNGEKRILKKIKLKGAPPKFATAAAASVPAKRKQPTVIDLTSDAKNGSSSAPKKADKESSFECMLCKKRFSEQSELKSHFLEHGNQSNKAATKRSIMLIECEWCPETFTTMSKAIEHKYRKHNYDSKNYFCTLCGRLFPLKVALEQHRNLEHKYDKNMKVPRLDFICNFCGTAFISHGALELHVKTAHNLEKRMMAHPFVPGPSKKVRLNQAGEIISIYYCHLCGSEYMLKFNLLKHIEDHHSYEERCAVPEDLLKCSTCDSVFYTKKAFDTHNVHHKPEDLYVTSEEQRLNIVARVDQDFDFRRVPSALDKALGSVIGSSGSDSAAALAKKHHRPKKGKSRSKTTCTATSSVDSSAAVLDLEKLTDAIAADVDSAAGMEALRLLLGDCGEESAKQQGKT